MIPRKKSEVFFGHMKEKRPYCSLPPVDQIIDQAKNLKNKLGRKIGIELGPDGVTLTPGEQVEASRDETVSEFDLAQRMSSKLGRRVTYTSDPAPGEAPGFTIREEIPKNQS